MIVYEPQEQALIAELAEALYKAAIGVMVLDYQAWHDLSLMQQQRWSGMARVALRAFDGGTGSYG